MSIQIIQGDCRTVLPTLAAGSVQCVVTSPPYFGLRDYGTATWDGGDPACDHTKDRSLGVMSSGLQGGKGTTNHQKEASYRDLCGKCGATRIDSQIGLEASPDLFIAEMVAVFREVWRVLRDDGTCWLNLGDSYGAGGAAKSFRNSPNANRNGTADTKAPLCMMAAINDGLKPKDLLMMPARVAIALQADGWFLRSDIIWAKPNPMPESVTDRPTTAHEHVFLLTKKPKYFYDADAVREEGVIPAGTLGAKGSEERFAQAGVNSRPPEYKVYSGTRNLRNVWTIATHAYPDAHFATFPPELAERCIKAGSKPGDTILDPFSGAGTTALVADRLGRHAIGIELNPEYSAMARNRVIDDAPLFAEVS